MMNCRNCGIMCGAVEFFDRPFCCISCEEEWDKKHKDRFRIFQQN